MARAEITRINVSRIVNTIYRRQAVCPQELPQEDASRVRFHLFDESLKLTQSKVPLARHSYIQHRDTAILSTSGEIASAVHAC